MFIVLVSCILISMYQVLLTTLVFLFSQYFNGWPMPVKHSNLTVPTRKVLVLSLVKMYCCSSLEFLHCALMTVLYHPACVAPSAGMWLKKFFKVTAEIKKNLLFWYCPEKKARSTDFSLLEVKDHERLVLNTIFSCFWDFCNILNHITGV